MGRIKWWQFLRFLGLEFWLPLPLLGLVFWIVSGLFTEHSFKHSNQSVESFQITADQSQPSTNILFIKVTVDRVRNISQVKVKQASQVYQTQEFELATIDLEQIETAISEKLGLSPNKVRRLLRYQLSGVEGEYYLSPLSLKSGRETFISSSFRKILAFAFAHVSILMTTSMNGY